MVLFCVIVFLAIAELPSGAKCCKACGCTTVPFERLEITVKRDSLHHLLEKTGVRVKVKSFCSTNRIAQRLVFSSASYVLTSLLKPVDS